MSLRSSTIYVEPKTVRRLVVLTKLYPERTAEAGGSLREKTADERADHILNEAIAQHFPQVIELERILSRAEKDFIKEISSMKRNK